jgi:SAM-dependent methyltransferase
MSGLIMSQILKRARRALWRHSGADLMPLLTKNVVHLWKTVTAGSESTVSAFDEKCNLETERICEIGSLDIDSPNAKYAVRYQPSPPELVKEILSRLAINHSDFTFVDFGAGKGRVLFIVSEFPFSRIIGVEFSPELVRAAEDNIKRFCSAAQRKREIQVALADVVDYEIPDGPIVCYFYNPFERPIIAQVAAKLIAACKSEARDMYVVYVDPHHRDVFEQCCEWKRCIDDPRFVVYRYNVKSVGETCA